MSNCFDYQDGTDSGGNPVMKRQCYCGTTACHWRPPITISQTAQCNHYWFKCEPETDDIEHCRNCGEHRQPTPTQSKQSL